MQSKTRRKNSKKRWIGWVLLKSVAPEESMPITSVHPMVVRRSDALHWCKTERLWRSSEERSEAPIELTVSSKASVQSTYYVPEMLSSVQQPSFQHRMNRCPIGASVGAITSARWNGYVRIKCHRKNRRLSIGSTDGPWRCCGRVREANG